MQGSFFTVWREDITYSVFKIYILSNNLVLSNQDIYNNSMQVVEPWCVLATYFNLQTIVGFKIDKRKIKIEGFFVGSTNDTIAVRP